MSNITEQEAIKMLKDAYGVEYSSEIELSAIEQLEICECLPETKVSPIRNSSLNKEINNVNDNENASVSGNVNDTYKHSVNLELTKRKLEVINELKSCNYRTPPPRVAKLLEELFQDSPSHEGHWLYVAQTWPPRVINRVINRLIKLHLSGRKKFKNPSAYFTYLVKFRAKRKDL